MAIHGNKFIIQTLIIQKMNKIILFGNVGKDAEVKHLESGKSIAKFSFATNKIYTNQAGEKVTETQWHNIVLWNKLAELAEKYVKKGSSIIIEGEISYRSYENKDDQTVYITEIVGNALHFAGNKKEDESVKKSEIKDDIPEHIQEQQDVSANEINDLPF
jgi:single-strand DNA-binding protein